MRIPAKTPLFWLMYVMFVMIAAGGLMATAQLAPIAKDFGVADVPVSFLGFTLPALTFALSIDRVLNGMTRPLFGWVSVMLSSGECRLRIKPDRKCRYRKPK